MSMMSNALVKWPILVVALFIYLHSASITNKQTEEWKLQAGGGGRAETTCIEGPDWKFPGWRKAKWREVQPALCFTGSEGGCDECSSGCWPATRSSHHWTERTLRCEFNLQWYLQNYTKVGTFGRISWELANSVTAMHFARCARNVMGSPWYYQSVIKCQARLFQGTPF